MHCRCQIAGAIIEEEISRLTTHVVAPIHVSGAEAAEKLGQEVMTLQWPRGIHFVGPEFVTHSLAKQRLLDVSE